MKTLFTSTVLSLALSATVAQAWTSNSGIRDIQFSGNGCSSYNARDIISADKDTASVLLDDFEATVYGSSAIYKTCIVDVEVKAPSGKKVKSIKIDNRGYTFIKNGGSRISQNIKFNGKNVDSYKKSGSKPTDRDFTLSGKTNLNGSCNSGNDTVVIWTVLEAKGSDAEISLDSIDFVVEYETCNGSGDWDDFEDHTSDDDWDSDEPSHDVDEDRFWYSPKFGKFKKNGHCKQYNHTDARTCETSKDNLSCHWKASRNKCKG